MKKLMFVAVAALSASSSIMATAAEEKALIDSNYMLGTVSTEAGPVDLVINRAKGEESLQFNGKSFALRATRHRDTIATELLVVDGGSYEGVIVQVPSETKEGLRDIVAAILADEGNQRVFANHAQASESCAQDKPFNSFVLHTVNQKTHFYCAQLVGR